LWLVDPQALADVVDGPRAVAEQLDDAEAGRFGQGGKRLDHGVEYATIGIFQSRNISRAIERA
jgi:hypothetical protein